jgi:hypothetical protein
VSAMAPGMPGGLLHGLIDDASLCTPAAIPLARALERYWIHRDGVHSWLLGRLLCPASRLAELAGHLSGFGRIPVGLVLDTGLAHLQEMLTADVEDHRLLILSTEISLYDQAHHVRAAHTALRALTRCPPGGQVFIELPLVPGWQDVLSLIAARGCGVKMRTGGQAASSVPSVRTVADFLKACVVEGAPFTMAGGMGHAVRGPDPRTGVEHHGFLNVLLATCLAVRGAGVPELMEALSVRDPAELTGAVLAVDAPTAALARTHLWSFGSRWFSGPVGELIALGLVDTPERTPEVPLHPVVVQHP